jgi:hypothetical protein
VTLLRRLAAIAMTAMLSAGNLAACAGWQPTPEARMACCTDEAACPMHASAAQGSEPTRVLTQTEADRCCGGATDRTSSNSAGTTSSSTAIAALPLFAAAIASVSTPALQQWRALVPHPVSPVPKHLLHTVLLV